jgi:ribonuclease III
LSRPNRPSAALQALGVQAPATGLFELALTHRSFAFEQTDPVEHNERLELLGDSVVGLVVTQAIFDSYPHMTEGDIATLRASVVNTSALAALARSIDLGEWIRLGRGEEASGGRDKDSVLADAFEALVGAAYLEKGFQTVVEALVPLFADEIERVVTKGESLDAKGALQELTARENGHRPEYEVTSSGPEHEKTFTARVFVEGRPVGNGTGRSKKEAEQNAAREALDRLGPVGSAERATGARAS